MVFVQYYHRDLAGKLSEPCGDRGVVILDGRNRVQTMHEDARKFNGFRRPKYEAYRLFRGESFSRCSAISELVKL